MQQLEKNDEILNIIAEHNHISVEEVVNIRNKQYSVDEMMQMSLVSQLRLVGRIKGVQSPTSKNMKELIDCILAIQEGRVAPKFTVRGRGIKGGNRLSAKNSSHTTIDDAVKSGANIEVHPSINLENCHTREDGTLNNTTTNDGIYPSGLTIGEDINPDNNVDPDDETLPNAICKEADIQLDGVLELMQEGYGFLRTNNYYQSKNNRDVYVSVQQIKRFNLRQGDKLVCTARYFDKSKSPSLIYIHSVNDVPCDKLARRPYFNDFEAAYPKERIKLEKGAERFDYSLRAIDLVAPVGKGQRGLIVAQPKTGKTTLLKKIAQSVTKGYPDIKVIVLLIDERPEEVTDFKESVPLAEVVYSTFDQTPFHHTAVAEMVLHNCKHRVEQGQDVLLLLDSVTRLARAYNKTAEVTGRTLTGGLDIAALETPKAFFGSARRVVAGGSLTILATALVETGSRMDDIIYEEFKGTGNMEIHLDRELSDRRIFPAIDLRKSGTRHEEMLLTQRELEGMWLIRRKLARTDNLDACLQLMDLITCTTTNEEFFDTLKVIK